jgi:hypothetical protein
MSTALANASRLKPEIRLAQAIWRFEADHSSEQEASFYLSGSGLPTTFGLGPTTWSEPQRSTLVYFTESSNIMAS